ncbi:YybH family protein [Dyadobacter arcticus]|uniref:Ketosteroid isomerase-like protein n=1 Tax=Dyadobacter arcticus TaxID=1078754 RepID=A0ABX0UM96_9BACT|nr:nuclear transport factor 2 family protein [Dyadobacter arcticus]NIJ52755.1 ketosteroid isomerase-like protein [Dyadobacter arcticus]
MMEQIKSLIAAQCEAIRNKDVAGATRNYAEEVLLFDIVGPLQHKGADAVRKRLKEWFGTFDDNAQPGFETVDLSVHADNNLGFSYGFNHISTKLKTGDTLDMFWRETLCWEKQGSQWKIVSAHSSVPFDVKSGKGQMGLKP